MKFLSSSISVSILVSNCDREEKHNYVLGSRNLF